jgi:hypothetical protein
MHPLFHAYGPRRGRQILLAFWLLPLAGCLTPKVDIMPRVGWMDLRGDFASGVDAPGGPNDFGTLGLDGREATFMPRIDLSSGRWDHTVDWISSQYDGEGEVENTFTLDGVTFTTGTPLRSDLEFGVARWIGTYDFAQRPEWTVGLGAGLGIYSLETRLQEQFTTAGTDTDQLGVAPHLALRLGYDFGAVDASLLLGWLDFSLNDTEAKYLDLDANLRWYLRQPQEGYSAALVAGYRWVSLDASYREEEDDEEVVWDSSLDGPYLGFSLGF